MEVDYRCYQYNIALPPFNENHPINKTLLPYWRSFWKKLLIEINSKEGLNEDEIHWQDRITYITKDEEVVGSHFIANYSICNFLKSEYALRYLPDNLEKLLNHHDSDCINTLQYLSINSNYGHRKTGIHFSSVLSDLSTLHHIDLQAKKTLSVARNSVGAHNMARKFGYRLYTSTNKHGEKSTVVYSENPKRHPKKSITRIADHFWENKKLITKKELAA